MAKLVGSLGFRLSQQNARGPKIQRCYRLTRPSRNPPNVVSRLGCVTFICSSVEKRGWSNDSQQTSLKVHLVIRPQFSPASQWVTKLLTILLILFCNAFYMWLHPPTGNN